MQIMDNMIKILGFFLLALLPAGGAKCQTIMDGKAEVRNLAVTRNGDRLFVSMDVDVSALKVKSNNEVVITPTITGNGTALALPAVMVAGRNRYLLRQRYGMPDGVRQLYRSGKVKVVEYRSVVPYGEWMDKASISAGCETSGCCGSPLAESRERLACLDLVPREFVPSFLYVSPPAQPKIREVQGSAYIDFPLNGTAIRADYRNNAAELQKILHTIDAVKNDADCRIVALSIKGYASPEGP